MAASGRTLMIALVIAVAVAPAAVSAGRLLQRSGDDRSGTQDRGYGRPYGGRAAGILSGKHNQQRPYTDGDESSSDDHDTKGNQHWGSNQQQPGPRSQGQDDTGSESTPQADNNGEDNLADLQPSWSNSNDKGASEQPSTSDSSAPQSSSSPASGKTSSGRHHKGGTTDSSNTPAGSDTSTFTPTGSATTPASPGNATNSNSGTLSDPELQKALDLHNSLRAKHGASPLVWSTQLATQAQNWAKGCSHSHSIKDGNWIYGESIQWGVLNFEAAIMEWYSEVSKYHGQPSCYSDETAHFSQIVWKATKNLGCGYSSCSDGMKFYVCQYTPGNGEQGSCQQNVQA